MRPHGVATQAPAKRVVLYVGMFILQLTAS
jgi:hypothetical protein